MEEGGTNEDKIQEKQKRKKTNWGLGSKPQKGKKKPAQWGGKKKRMNENGTMHGKGMKGEKIIIRGFLLMQIKGRADDLVKIETQC